MHRDHRRSMKVGRRALALSGALALAFASSGTAFAAGNPVASQEWALGLLNSNQIHSQFQAHGKGVIVAVVDSGVDPNQPDLQGRLVDGVSLTDPSNPTSDFSDKSSDSHGTGIATLIAASPHSSGSGMLGLADEAEIMPVAVGSTSGDEATLTAGVQYAVSHGAQVINISEGSSVSEPAATSAIDMALSHGVVVVVSTGNDGESGNAPSTIATIPGVIDVAGIDQNGQVYHFGHNGPDVDVAAPANSIEVGEIGGQYGNVAGTSFASPWVSAEAALIIGLHPDWTSYQVVAAIIDNTSQVATGKTQAGQRLDNFVGYGVIDPVAALGASAPAGNVNPLNGPALTSTPAQNAHPSSNASSNSGGGATSGSTPPSSASKSSSSTPLIIGIVIAAVVVIGLIIFFASRGKNRRGPGGPGGPGGGYPQQTPPGGGQYGQQQNPYGR